MATDTAPLSGLRVLEIAGEFIEPVGRHLVDLGADVTLIEPPGGSRSAPHRAPTVVLLPSRAASISCDSTSANGSVVLDLDTEEGSSVPARIPVAERAMFLMTSFNQQELESHGLDYASLTAINPNINPDHCHSVWPQGNPRRIRG